jgi:hypothetical protein
MVWKWGKGGGGGTYLGIRSIAGTVGKRQGAGGRGEAAVYVPRFLCTLAVRWVHVPTVRRFVVWSCERNDDVTVGVDDGIKEWKWWNFTLALPSRMGCMHASLCHHIQATGNRKHARVRSAYLHVPIADETDAPV